jgi:hypothetical protein
MRPIGFSHGVLFKLSDVYTPENISLFHDCGCTAIEINCHSAKEVSQLDSILPHLKGFEYISLHMPCDKPYRNDEQTKQLLKTLANFYRRAGAKLAVIHPDLVEDWGVFDGFPLDWAIENMDDRKEHYKDVTDLKNFFQDHPAWDLVLDVGHCNANDKSMALAADLIAEFKDRIKEIHLSGYEVFHDPLHRTKQTEIIRCCQKLDVPIIIESTFEPSDGTAGVQKEYDYIISVLG